MRSIGHVFCGLLLAQGGYAAAIAQSMGAYGGSPLPKGWATELLVYLCCGAFAGGVGFLRTKNKWVSRVYAGCALGLLSLVLWFVLS